MKQQDTESVEQPQGPVGGVADRAAGLNRRTLLRAGAGVAPVLLTLRSGPVGATTTACTVASSFVSVATFASRSPGSKTIKCSSLNVGHWRDEAITKCVGEAPPGPGAPAAVQWPDWGKQKVLKHLADVGGHKDMRVATVLKLPLASSGQLGVLQHVLGLTLTIQYSASQINTGATLNGKSLTKFELVTIWKKYVETGRYVNVGAGVSWNEAELIGWLKMLQFDIPLPA